MTTLSPIQPFGTKINPFGSDFRDIANAVGELAMRVSREQKLAAVQSDIDRDNAFRLPCAVGRIIARSSDVNATYDIDPVWGAPIQIRGKAPWLRPIIPNVIYEAAEVGGPALMFLDDTGEAHFIIDEHVRVEDCTAPPPPPVKVPSTAREQTITVHDEFDYNTAASAHASGIFHFNMAT